ncbi:MULTISPECIES: DUF397 domain-containing protein [unclassified Streptomyces]|uniref:DUF397 domain-containing protein n=1 Tax=unclassified Streptomyces TaxID=2593676 RepID=UPI00225141FB|nr:MULTISPECIES: DUF397 domain-containing protein [unclassified Streptomyces]WSP56653.1 DUF397 domain-containing protein [Streptomyces sp. NBC_01241]WSU22629.1 DUF397 domain-containing protein [Streptomyces sp. NBC_01108]MCX4788400.1 DUF397 domain-containing protein [Streptomyces sp. NBC_01221]MCX4795839.1 DUF397 domain-containing protein [Streptomyces sp. NBC_01242]WSJ37121.1 DUF397 domain-containing protein [Streptomyces sp. NBC_01321]
MHQHAWQRSSYCGQGESCLHVAAHNSTVSLTESSDSTGAILRTTPAAWAALVRTLKDHRAHG